MFYWLFNMFTSRGLAVAVGIVLFTLTAEVDVGRDALVISWSVCVVDIRHTYAAV